MTRNSHFSRPAETDPYGASNWSAGDGAAAGHGGRAVSSTDVNDSCEGAGNVSLGKGGLDHPGCQGSCGEEGGRDEAGGGDEEGEESTVDGILVRARLGKERQLPYSAVILMR